MDKSGIKNFAIEARNILRESAIKKAGVYGITIDYISEPVQKLGDSQVFQTIAGDEVRLYEDDLKKRNNLISAIKAQGFEQVIEETAYTWFNRLIAIRFMEVNDYLPSRIRVLSSEAGGSTPDIVTNAMEADLNLRVEELDQIQKAKNENRYDEAFQMLFVKQCNELNVILPGLFEKTDDYMELLLDITYTGDGVVKMLTNQISEDDFNVEKQGQVEIIGWMYQYYNTELKDDTFAKLKKNIKITKERIPAATQLFTPDWIVRYMVENSLGRVWIDHLRAVDETIDEKTKAEEFGWKYYLPEAEQEDSVAVELVKVRAEYKDLRPQDILCIDPCSGSGHILVYMFDVLMAIYESEGISERDAAFDILEKNIYGMDIDKRAYQLSYFALMMKGRAAAGRRFFRGVEDENGERRQVELNVYAIDESNRVDKTVVDAFGVSMPAAEKEIARGQVETLLSEMHDAKEYGSIINVTDFDMELLRKYLSDREESRQLNVAHIGAGLEAEKIWKLAKIGKVLAQKYDAVVTNPPYMGNMSVKMTGYVVNEYSIERYDLYAVFMKKCRRLLLDRGVLGMITQQAWMFLSSFEKMRKDILSSTFINLIQLGSRAFDEIGGEVVQTVMFTQRRISYNRYICVYKDLTKWGSQEEKRKKYFTEGNYYNSQSNYSMIPRNVYAYQISKNAIKLFEQKNLSDYSVIKSGIVTGNNDLFLKVWFEIDFNKIDFESQVFSEEIRWVPMHKGGGNRKHYGLHDYIMNIHDIWYSNKTKDNVRRGDPDFYFKTGLTWSTLSNKLSVRKSPKGFVFDTKGSMCFILDNDLIYYFEALLNSKIAEYYMSFLSPTLDFNQGAMGNIPVITDEERVSNIEQFSKQNEIYAKNDWDAFETSWDFARHPLVRPVSTISDAYTAWQGRCNERFINLKSNEETLNRIFIDIYGFKDELSPEVEDKDVTVRRIFDTKEDIPESMKGSSYAITKHDVIVSLVSYAVGCMFGRYSLDEEGLIYAGGKFDLSRYKTFPADDDAIIPITDEEYFDDDIVKRFVEFVQVVYGKDTLEENLQFIADALGNKGDTSREVIRNYFLNDFFKDHAKTYSVTGSGKRPIYWLFDSGKQNGFKCLIYMHRYTSDTVGLIRSVYLKKASDAIQKALDNAEYIIANTESNVDRAMSTKKRDKYVKQLAEIKPYYQALSHVAMQRIELDLDDGVKVNYAKFQGIEVGRDGEKKQTINLLAKI